MVLSYPLSERMRKLQPSPIREILKIASDPSFIPFAAGNPAPEAFPTQEIARITAEILAENPIGALQYAVTEGYNPLRETLKSFLMDSYNIGRETDELIILSGAQQAMDFTCKVLCDEEDVIIVEEPSFVGALNTFRSYRANLIPVKLEEDGISLEKMEQALQEHAGRVRFIYLIPTFQNPSGLTMSLAKRKAVYELAKRYHVLIMEDNPYGELRFSGEHIPPIKSFDEDGLVIYVGTFSKVLAPGIRIGYACGPKEIIAKMVVAKQCNDTHTNIMSQILCYRFMTENDFGQHLEFLRGVYRKKSSLMIDNLDRLVGDKISYTRPNGGLFTWCELPPGVDMLAFVQALLESKLAVVPGNAFMVDPAQQVSTFRMNYSTPTDEQLVRGVEILADVVGRTL